MKKDILVIGGLGIESKTLINGSASAHIDSLGGSAWLCSIVARALSCKVRLLSRIGSDSNGEKVLYELSDKGIKFIGTQKGLTQKFNTQILSGEPQNYEASFPNQSVEEFFELLPLISKADIILFSFNECAFYNKAFHELKRKLKKGFFVANPSGAIYSLGDKYLDYIKGYNVVTLNHREANYLAEIYKCSIDELIKLINKNNEYVFVTSKESVECFDGIEVYKYNCKSLDIVYDATGAGDAFATAIAILLVNNYTIKVAVEKATIIAQLMCQFKNKSDILPNQWEAVWTE